MTFFCVEVLSYCQYEDTPYWTRIPSRYRIRSEAIQCADEMNVKYSARIRVVAVDFFGLGDPTGQMIGVVAEWKLDSNLQEIPERPFTS